MLTQCFAFLCRFGGIKKRLWRRWYDYLAGYRQVADWTCMNYGYAGLTEARTISLPAEQEPERWCLQLYHHVASAVPLKGKHVLEVGSGRGGGAAFVKRFFAPEQLTGVDFSGAAVALCRERYPVEGLTFETGDAENLPFAEGSFDAVINVESSHCYGDFPKFLGEVYRVLRPGGHFLYTDFRDATALGQWREHLCRSGMETLQETEITPNVLAALALDDTRKRSLIRQLIPRWMLKSFQDFAGTKDSVVHRAFVSGEMRYFSFVCRKPEKPSA